MYFTLRVTLICLQWRIISWDVSSCVARTLTNISTISGNFSLYACFARVYRDFPSMRLTATEVVGILVKVRACIYSYHDVILLL